MSKPSWFDGILIAGVAGAIGVKAEDFGKGEHECDEDGRVDIDICSECGEHAGFCSVCGQSSCCGSGSYQTDVG